MAADRFEYDDERFLTLLQTFDQEKNPTKKAALVQFVPWLRFLPSNRKLLNKIYDTCGKFIGAPGRVTIVIK